MGDLGSDWRLFLARQLDELGPMVRTRYAPELGGVEQISGERLLRPEHLRASIMRARSVESVHPRDDDLRIAASRMSRLYCAALSSVALAGLANGVGIDLAPGRFALAFSGNSLARVSIGPGEVLRCAERPTTWPVTGPVLPTLEQLREYVWTNLYARNVGPMIDAAAMLVDVPERFLWTNAAEWVATVLDAAIEYLDPASAAPFVADCRALLAADSLPGLGGRPNPLRGRLAWLPFDGGEPRHGIQTRRLCCLIYQHTDRHGRLCQNCPLLPLPDRAALVRERRGVGMTKPGGPAEQRCIELGRNRLRGTTRNRRSPDV